MAGTLFIVATPIGNLQDISERALGVLRDVDIVACEDTRRTGKLLKHFQIRKTLISYHAHNEANRKADLVKHLLAGKTVALVSDAGMPGISDPGYELINAARSAGVSVTVIPGPSAFVSAAVLSGLPLEPLYFGGFLPPKKGARRKALAALTGCEATLVFYESPRRLVKCLDDCLAVFGNRKAAVVREITKIHEESRSGKLSELLKHYDGTQPKGEIVILIDRDQAMREVNDSEASLLKRFQELRREGFDKRKALKIVVKEFGMARDEAYRILQRLGD